MKPIPFLFLAAALLSGNARAEDEIYKPECLGQATQAVARKSKAPSGSVSFFNAALVGDGVNALETITFQVKGLNGLFVVTMEYDDCSVFAGPKLLNN